MTIWIITVNFGDTEPTKTFINSLEAFQNINSIKIGIADNSSTATSFSKLEQIKKETHLDVLLFSFKKNYYYWPAAKKVINNLRKKVGSYPDWIIICNNDISFCDKIFFEELSKIDLKKYPIIGPNVINSNGKQLNPFMIAPQSLAEKIYWAIYFISYPISVIMLKINKFLKIIIKKRNFENLSKKQVYAVHGSIILFSNHYFKNGGYIDNNFDMYGEELTVAETAKKLNIPITFFPQLNVIHDEHKSTAIANSRLLFEKAKQSHKYFQSIIRK